MKKQKGRILKVYAQPSNGKTYPEIRLSGKWLEELGYKVGDSIRVTIRKQKISISKVSRTK